MSALFVPPGNVQVRIKAAVERPLYFNARRGSTGGGYLEADGLDNDTAMQWFQMLPGTGQFEGLYSIFSVMNDQCLFGCEVEEPGTGIVAVALADNVEPKTIAFYVKLVPNAAGTQFQIFPPTGYQCPITVVGGSQDMPLRWNTDPSDQNVFASWWVFEYKDMVFDHIDYHFDTAQLIDVTPTSMAEETATNNTETRQVSSITLSSSVTDESTYDVSVGMSVTLSDSVTVGLPEVAGDTVKASVTASTKITFGETHSNTFGVKKVLEVHVDPGQSVKAIMSGKNGKVDVPFDAVYRDTSGNTMALPGVYHGVQTWDVDVSWNPLN